MSRVDQRARAVVAEELVDREEPLGVEVVGVLEHQCALGELVAVHIAQQDRAARLVDPPLAARRPLAARLRLRTLSNRCPLRFDTRAPQRITIPDGGCSLLGGFCMIG